MMRHRTVWVIAVVGLSLAAVACGGDDAPEASNEAATASTEVETQAEEPAAEADTGAPAESQTARAEPEQRPEQRGRDVAHRDPTESEEEAVSVAGMPTSDEASDEGAGQPESGDGVEAPESEQAGATDQASEEPEAQADPHAGGEAPASEAPDAAAEGDDEAEGEAEASVPEPDSDPAEAASEIDLPDWLAGATEVVTRRGPVEAGTHLLTVSYCTHCGEREPIISWWDPEQPFTGEVRFFGRVNDFIWRDAGQAILDCGACPHSGEAPPIPPTFYWSTDGGLTWAVLPLPEPDKWSWRLEWMESPTRWVASRRPAEVVEASRVGLNIRPTGEPAQFVLLPDLTVLAEPPPRPAAPPEPDVDAHGQKWTAEAENAASSASRLLRDGQLVHDFVPFEISGIHLSPDGERLVFSLDCADPQQSCAQQFPNDAFVVVVEARTGSWMILRVPLQEFRYQARVLETKPPLLSLRWHSDELLEGFVRWRWRDHADTIRPVALHLASLTIDIYAQPEALSSHRFLVGRIPNQTQPALTWRGPCLARHSLPRTDHEWGCVAWGEQAAATGISAVYPDGSRWLLIEAAEGPWWVEEAAWRAGLGE